jgi:hypothetical protein
MVVLCAQSGMSYKTIDIGNIQFNIHGISSCIGTVAYSFQCVGFILHVRNRMANKSEVKSVVSYVFTLGWFVYTIFPIIGLATFGALVQPVFTDNFKLTEFVRILLLTISLMLFIGFAQCLFPVSKLFDQWSDDLVQTRRYSLSHNVKRILCRTFLVAVVAVTVVLVPDFKFVVDVTGTVFNGLLGVILPCLWYMKLCNPFVHDMPTGFQESLLANEDSEIVEIDEVPQHTFMDKVVFYGPPITYILFFASASVCILTYTILGEEEEV